MNITQQRLAHAPRGLAGSLAAFGEAISACAPPSLPLHALYQHYVHHCQSVAGLLIASRTVRNIEAQQAVLLRFIQDRDQPQLAAEALSPAWACLFLDWLRTSAQYKLSTALKHLTGLQRILRWGVEQQLIQANPLLGFDCQRPAPKQVVCLSAEELLRLTQLPLTLPSLARVRDCFVFQCWTGCSYADLAGLDTTKHIERYKGRRLLRVRRSSSTLYGGYACTVPLLPEAERLLAKYGDALPVPTNQVYNRYLKEVGQQGGLQAHSLTAQVGRTTGGLQLLKAGVSVERVSKLLGHSSPQKTHRAFAPYLATDACAGQRQQQLQEEFGLAGQVGSKRSRGQIRQQLEKLTITFGFVARPLALKDHEQLKRALGVDFWEVGTVGVLRGYLAVRGRDSVRFQTSIRTVRGCWDTKQQRAVAGNVSQLHEQVTAFRSLLTRLFVELIERKQALTAGALLRAYRKLDKKNFAAAP